MALLAETQEMALTAMQGAILSGQMSVEDLARFIKDAAQGLTTYRAVVPDESEASGAVGDRRDSETAGLGTPKP